MEVRGGGASGRESGRISATAGSVPEEDTDPATDPSR